MNSAEREVPGMARRSHLKVFLEHPGFSVGCVDLEYGEEEMKSFPMALARLQVGKLLVSLRESFGDSLRVDLVDPRSITSLFDILRFRVKCTEPAWVLDGRLVFRGVPEWEDLQQSIELAIGEKGPEGGKG
jgi:hypothetical protein